MSKASASLPAWAGGPVQAYRTSIFFGVKLMFVSVMNFGQIKKIMFVVVNIFGHIQLIKFVVVTFFGHILTNFWSYRFGQVN